MAIRTAGEVNVICFHCIMTVLDDGLTSLKLQTLNKTCSVVNTVKKNRVENLCVSEEVYSELQ
jgi:hypothetical protein